MNFVKMHGCGNDFVIIDDEKGFNYEKLAVSLCNRKTGVGADGLIIVKKNPLEMIFYNQDGSRASMCGNGIRCFARYCYEKKLCKNKKLECITQAGTMKIEITSVEPFLCKVDMGRPNFTNQMIHVSDNINSFGRVLTIKRYHLTIYSFFMGTIHTVLFVESLDSQVLTLAEDICKNPLFRNQTNVNFVKVIDDKTLEVKTFERGVGWTLACGTGACASVVASHKLGLTGPKVTVKLPMGFLNIEIGKRENVMMEGSAVLTYTGELKECV